MQFEFTIAAAHRKGTAASETAMPLLDHRSGRDDMDADMRKVFDDLAAIFGPGVPASDGFTHRRTSPRAGPGGRRRVSVAIALSAIAVAMVGGVVAGRNATGLEAGAGNPPVRRHVSLSVAAAPASTASLAIARTERPPSPPVAAMMTADPIVATMAMPRLQDAAPPRPVPSTPLQSVELAPHRPSQTVRHDAALEIPVPARRHDYDDYEEERLPSRLDLAEQRLDDAFERAEAAGVRRGILRGYRREWDRARGEAADQPRAALRLYAMITSDVLNLATDEDAIDRDYER